MVKHLSIVAGLLLVIGITGVIFTIKPAMKGGENMEEQVIDLTDIHDVIVYADNATVTILPADDEEARVELYGSEQSDEFSVETTEDVLNIHYKTKWKLFSFDLFSRRQLKVYLPEKLYEKIDVESNNGRIELSDVSSNDLTVKTDNGRVQLDDVQSERLFTASQNGRISFENISSEEINAETSNGRITMEKVSGSIVGETHNGSISLITDHIDRPIELKSHNGKIDIESAKKPTNVIFDLKTDNGKITVFGDNNWDTVVGDGDNIIKLFTHNGKITIR